MAGGTIFTPSILAQHRALGSTVGARSFPSMLTSALMDFISKRDSADLGTANVAGLPTVQHSGGPVGFIRRVDDQTIGFADYAGNRHYIT